MTDYPSRTILHLSDTHILPTDDDRLHGVDTLANLRLALDSVAEHAVMPDVIVISGDLANGGECWTATVGCALCWTKRERILKCRCSG
jgi:3',5'-cyclic AMP phosphodiesterase CpdA